MVRECPIKHDTLVKTNKSTHPCRDKKFTVKERHVGNWTLALKSDQQLGSEASLVSFMHISKAAMQRSNTAYGRGGGYGKLGNNSLLTTTHHTLGWKKATNKTHQQTKTATFFLRIKHQCYTT